MEALRGQLRSISTMNLTDVQVDQRTKFRVCFMLYSLREWACQPLFTEGKQKHKRVIKLKTPLTANQLSEGTSKCAELLP